MGSKPEQPMRPKQEWVHAIDSELGHEDERNNCFNLVKSTEPVYVAGQKYRDKTILAS